jgi:hypothetical protein
MRTTRGNAAIRYVLCAFVGLCLFRAHIPSCLLHFASFLLHHSCRDGDTPRVNRAGAVASGIAVLCALAVFSLKHSRQISLQGRLTPVALDLDGGEMPMPFNDDTPFPVVPGSNIHIFGGYEPASPRDNPCARYGRNFKFACQRPSGQCWCFSTKPNSQLGFIGGAGIEGGQGNSDSIYGSHDDHSTYGIFGSGWQGPGNGEAPGDLWNPARGQRRGVGRGQTVMRQGGMAVDAGPTWSGSWFGGRRGLANRAFEKAFENTHGSWAMKKKVFGKNREDAEMKKQLHRDQAEVKKRLHVLNMQDLPVPIGYDGDRDRCNPKPQNTNPEPQKPNPE